MAVRTGLKAVFWSGFLFLSATGCGHRGGNTAVSRASKPDPNQPVMMTVVAADRKTFRSSPAAIQFDYPGCWAPCKNHTSVFKIEGPAIAAQSKPCLCLDIPKLPWHISGMIPIAMVVRGYVDDLRTNLMPDAAIREETSLSICGANARRVTCAGHVQGKPSVDIAVIMIHADQVYILSADSEDAGKTTAQQTLDDALSSLKWLK